MAVLTVLFLLLFQTKASHWHVLVEAQHPMYLPAAKTQTHNVGFSPNMQSTFKNEWTAEDLTNVGFGC